jgi:hypothetical protein
MHLKQTNLSVLSAHRTAKHKVDGRVDQNRAVENIPELGVVLLEKVRIDGTPEGG